MHFSIEEVKGAAHPLSPEEPAQGRLRGSSISVSPSSKPSLFSKVAELVSKVAELVSRIFRFIKSLFGYGVREPSSLGERNVHALVISGPERLNPENNPVQSDFEEEFKEVPRDGSVIPVDSHMPQNPGSSFRINQILAYRCRGERVVVDLNGEILPRVFFDQNTRRNIPCFGFQGHIDGTFLELILDSEIINQLPEPLCRAIWSAPELSHWRIMSEQSDLPLAIQMRGAPQLLIQDSLDEQKEELSTNPIQVHASRVNDVIEPLIQDSLDEQKEELSADPIQVHASRVNNVIEPYFGSESAINRLTNRQFFEGSAAFPEPLRRVEEGQEEAISELDRLFLEAADRERKAIEEEKELAQGWEVVFSEGCECKDDDAKNRCFNEWKSKYGLILTNYVIGRRGLTAKQVLNEADTGLAEDNLQQLQTIIGDKKNLIAYLFHLRTAGKAIDDCSAISFNEGKIEEVSGEREITKEVFATLLNATYGSFLGTSVIARYDLMQKETLTLGDLKKALIGIAANVRVDDLRNLFNEIKNNQSEEFECKEFLKENNPEAYEELKRVDSFQSLTSDQIGYLLSAFRTVPTGDEKEIGRMSETPFVEDAFNDIIFKHDHELLVKIEQWDTLLLEDARIGEQQELHRLAVSEHVGKNLCYRNLEEGMVFALPDRKNYATFYRVHSCFQLNGVMPSLAVPILENSDEEELKQESHDIHLVFRGTSSLVQWHRNTDYRGVGSQAFAEQEEKVIKMVADYLSNTSSENVVLHISGHSLGGCDTQRALASIMEKIAESDKNSPLRKISQVVVKTHNSPRPEPSVNQRLKRAVKRIFDNKENFKVQVDLTHIRYFDQSYEDVVSTLGEVLVGADQDGNESIFKNARPFFRRQLLDIRIENNDGYTNGLRLRHGFKAFNTALSKDINWSIKANFSSDHDNVDEMEGVLAGNYLWNDNESAWIPSLLANLSWYMQYPGTAVKRVARVATNVLVGSVVKPAQLLY
ncbi:MAG: hypothetical protein WD595_00955 [Waddliaceae bacterium]